MPPDVWSARTVVEVPEPRVMEEPGRRVWLETIYWDCEFAAMVSPLTIIGARLLALAGGADTLRDEVVRPVEPAALVVVRIMAGRRFVEEMTAPWALVEVIMVGMDAEIDAMERLIEETMLP